MNATNDRMRAALRDIEGRATAALHNQPETSDECGRHLNKALAGIELKAHVARCGQDRESPAEGVQSQNLRNGEAEADDHRVGRESVVQAGMCSNNCQ